MRSFLTAYGLKLLAGLLLASVVGNAFLAFRYKGAQIAHLRTVNKLTRVTAELEKMTLAVEFMAKEGQAREDRLKRAQLQSQSDLEQARKRADRVRDTKPNGCLTPPEVLAADL